MIKENTIFWPKHSQAIKQEKTDYWKYNGLKKSFKQIGFHSRINTKSKQGRLCYKGLEGRFTSQEYIGHSNVMAL